MGPLNLMSSMTFMVRYTRQGIDWLRLACRRGSWAWICCCWGTRNCLSILDGSSCARTALVSLTLLGYWLITWQEKVDQYHLISCFFFPSITSAVMLQFPFWRFIFFLPAVFTCYTVAVEIFYRTSECSHFYTLIRDCGALTWVLFYYQFLGIISVSG